MKLRIVKALSFLLCAALLSGVCGCEKNHGQEEHDTTSSDENAYIRTYCGQTAVYHNGMLYYIFPTTRSLRYLVVGENEGGPLCPKPECTHDSSECGAMIASLSGNPHLMLHNGRLFWTEQCYGGWQLVSMTPGESDSRIEAKYELQFFNGAAFYSAFCGDMLYYFGDRDTVKSGRALKRLEVYRHKINDGEPELLYGSDEEPDTVLRVKVHGESVYLARVNDSSLKLLVLDMESGEVSTLYSGDAPEGFSELVVEGDRIVFQGYYSIAELNLLDGEWTELFRTDRSISAASDKYVFVVTDKTHYRCVEIGGDVAAEGVIAAEDFEYEDFSKQSLGCIDGKMYFYFKTEGAAARYFLVTYDPETDVFEVVGQYNVGGGLPGIIGS